MILALAASTPDTGTDNHVSLLGLVAKPMGLLGSGGTVARQNVGALAVFPSTNSQQKSEGIGLLVAPQLFHVLVRSHGDLSSLPQPNASLAVQD
jgi:hypothetical protein